MTMSVYSPTFWPARMSPDFVRRYSARRCAGRGGGGIFGRRGGGGGGGGWGAVGGLVGLGWWGCHSLPSQVKSPAVSRPNYAVVHSQPLPAAALVLTRPLAIDQHVASFTNVQRVQTAPGGGQFREIDDDELLTLAEPKPVALVRRGPHTAELIVLNSTHPGASPPN